MSARAVSGSHVSAWDSPLQFWTYPLNFFELDESTQVLELHNYFDRETMVNQPKDLSSTLI